MERNAEWPYDMQDPFSPMSQYEQGYMYYKYLIYICICIKHIYILYIYMYVYMCIYT